MEFFFEESYSDKGYHKITPSMISTHATCPRQYFYQYIEKIPYTFIENTGLRRGRVIQTIFEHIINDNLWDKPYSICDTIAVENGFANFKEVAIPQFEEILKYFYGLSQKYILKSEIWTKYGMITPFWKGYLAGRADFVLYDRVSLKVVGIIDGKVGKLKKRYYGRPYWMLEEPVKWTSPYLFQLLFYALNWIDAVQYVSFYFWDSAYEDVVLIDESSRLKLKDDIDVLLKRTLAKTAVVDNYPNTGIFCKWCSFETMCKESGQTRLILK